MLSLISSLVKIMQALMFSIWRAMRGKPDFLHTADVPIYWRAHIALYIALKMLAANYNNPSMSWLGVVAVTAAGCAAVVFSVRFCFVKKNQSSMLATSLLSAFIGWDIAGIILMRVIELFTEMTTAIEYTILVAFTIAVLASSIAIQRRFKAMPREVRRAGYKPSLEGDFTWPKLD